MPETFKEGKWVIVFIGLFYLTDMAAGVKITIIGNSQLPAQMPQDASFLYSNNVLNFLKTMVKEGNLHADFNNEIIKGACITPELFV